MASRLLFLVVAAGAGAATFFAAHVQGMDDRWRQLSAAIAVTLTLAGCLWLFADGAAKADSK